MHGTLKRVGFFLGRGFIWLKPDRNSTADVFDSDKRVVLQTARGASTDNA